MSGVQIGIIIIPPLQVVIRRVLIEALFAGIVVAVGAAPRGSAEYRFVAATCLWMRATFSASVLPYSLHTFVPLTYFVSYSFLFDGGNPA